MAEETSDTFQCHCGKQFKRNSAFRRHQEVAHSTCASHKCAECGKTFGNANTLTMHMSVHEKKEAFTRLVVRPATRSTRSSLRALHEDPGTGALPGTAAAAALAAGSQQSGASSTQQSAAGKEGGGGEPPRSKRQQPREAKHDISSGSSSGSSNTIGGSALQSDCVRQTRAGAKEAGNNSGRRVSPAAATSANTPAAVVDRDSGTETRARTAAAAEAAAAASAAAASAASSSLSEKAVVGVPEEQASSNPAACQQQQQQWQREGAGRSDRLPLRDEVCNDAAGSLRVDPSGGGRVAVADRSSTEEEEEEGAVQGTGGGRPGAPLPRGRDESSQRPVDNTPHAHLIDNANEKCNVARCPQTNKQALLAGSRGHATLRAGGASVNNLVSTVGNPTTDDCTTANPATSEPASGSSDSSDSIHSGQPRLQQQIAGSSGQGVELSSLTTATSSSSSSSNIGSTTTATPSDSSVSTTTTDTTTVTATNTASGVAHLPHLNGILPDRHALNARPHAGLEEEEGEEEDEYDCYEGGEKPALRKSCRDRKENPIWKTLLTGRMYEEVLSSVDCARGGPASKRARRSEVDAHVTLTPHGGQQQQQQQQQHQQQQPGCGHNLAMIPTTVVKQEPTDFGFCLDNVKQELVETDDETGQFLPEMVTLQYQRLKRGPVRRNRLGSMSGAGHVQRNSPTATFDCLVCGKTFISEKYLSMHISLHETTKAEPGTGGMDGSEGGLLGSNTMCPGQVNPKILDEGEVYRPLESAIELPSVPIVVEQISTSNGNHFKPSPPKKSPSSNGSSSNGSSSSTTKKPTKLQTDGGWSCSLCNKTFAHNSGYKNHMRTHSNERPYVCHICDIGFKEKYHLKKHNLFIHSNELPEKCRVCGKRFKDSTAVRAHERIHSDERPFACRQCAKTFKTSECLWHHEHRSKTCGMALGEIIAQERLVRRRRRFPKSNGSSGGGAQQQSPQSPASGSDTNPETSPATTEHEANGDLLSASYKWNNPHHMPQHHHPHDPHHQGPPQPQPQHHQLNNGSSEPHPHHHPHHQKFSLDQYMPPVSNFFPTAVTNNSLPKENVSNAAKHSLIASQLQSCVQPLHAEVTSALQQTPLPPPPNQPQVPVCVEQHNMSPPPQSAQAPRPPPPGDEDQLSPVNLAMTMTMKDLNCLNEIPHVMHAHEEEMMVAHSMYPAMTAGDVKQERDAFGYSMDEDEENWVTTNMDKIMDKEDDLIDSKVDAILSNMASSMSSAFGMLAGDPLPSPPMPDFSDGKEYQCRVCRKAFTDPVAYQRHSKVHSDERPFVCLKCDIGFKMKVHLKKHNLYVHSDEYPCECQYCGKKFKDSSAVKLHERTHSDTRPFGCTGCGKAFKTRENLWGHQHRGKCIAGRKKGDQEGCFDEQTSAKASILNNGISAHASVNTNGVTAQACVNNSQVTAHASIENNQITAHATFANNQFTAHASVINNQVTAHASITNNNVSAQASITDVTLQNGTFTYSNSMQGGNCTGPSVVTSMTDTKSMTGSIPSTTTAPPMTTQYGGNPPTMAKSFIAQSLMTPPLNKDVGGLTEGATLRTGQQQQNASPTAGSLPVTCTTSLPDASADLITSMAQTQKEKSSLSAAGKWPTLKEFLSKGIGPPTPVPTWSGVPPVIAKINGQATMNNNKSNNNNNNNNNNSSNNNNNNGEYKQLANDYPALKERLSRNFFSQLPTVVTVAPPPPASSANNTSYPSSPASSNLSAPYSGQTTPTAGTSPYGKGRDSVSPYSDYSPGSGGVIPSFQSTFLKRTNPPPLSAFGNNPMLRGEDPNIPIIYWDDESDQRPPSSAWTSPESDSMFQDISESVFTQL